MPEPLTLEQALGVAPPVKNKNTPLSMEEALGLPPAPAGLPGAYDPTTPPPATGWNDLWQQPQDPNAPIEGVPSPTTGLPDLNNLMPSPTMDDPNIDMGNVFLERQYKDYEAERLRRDRAQSKALLEKHKDGVSKWDSQMEGAQRYAGKADPRAHRPQEGSQEKGNVMEDWYIDWDNLPICGESPKIIVSPYICIDDTEFPLRS